jgi:hypothetical protein
MLLPAPPKICFVITEANKTAVAAVMSVVSGGSIKAMSKPSTRELKSK